MKAKKEPPTKIHKTERTEQDDPKLLENAKDNMQVDNSKAKSSVSYFIGDVDIAEMCRESRNDNGGKFGDMFNRLIAPYNEKVFKDREEHVLEDMKADSFVNSRQVVGLLTKSSDPDIVCVFNLQDLRVQPPFPFIDVVKLLTAPSVSIKVTSAKKFHGSNFLTHFAQTDSILVGGEIPPELKYLVKKKRHFTNHDVAQNRMQILRRKMKVFRRLDRQIVLGDCHKINIEDLLSGKAMIARTIDINWRWSIDEELMQDNKPKRSVDTVWMNDKKTEVRFYKLNGWVLDCFFDATCGLLRCPDTPSQFCYFTLTDWELKPPFTYRDLVQILNKPHVLLRASAAGVEGNHIKFCAMHRSILISGLKEGDPLIVPSKTCMERSALVMGREAKLKQMEQHKQSALNYDTNFHMVQKIIPSSILSATHPLAFSVVDKYFQVMNQPTYPVFDMNGPANQVFASHQSHQSHENKKTDAGAKEVSQQPSSQVMKAKKEPPTKIHKTERTEQDDPKLLENAKDNMQVDNSKAKSSVSYFIGDVDIAEMCRESRNDNGGKFGDMFNRLIAPYNEKVFKDREEHVLEDMKADSFVNSRQVVGLLTKSSDPDIVCVFNLQDLRVQPPFPFIDVVKLLTAPSVSIKVTSAKKFHGSNFLTHFAQTDSILVGGEIPPELKYLVKKKRHFTNHDVAQNRMQILRRKMKVFRRLDRQIVLGDCHKINIEDLLSGKAMIARTIDINWRWSIDEELMQDNKPKRSVDTVWMNDKKTEVRFYKLNGWVLDCFFDATCGLLRCPDTPSQFCYFTLTDWELKPPFTYRDLVQILNKPHVLLRASAAGVEGNHIKFCAMHRSILISGLKEGDPLIVPSKTCMERSALVMGREAKLKQMEQHKQSALNYDTNFHMVQKIIPSSILSATHPLAFSVVDKYFQVMNQPTYPVFDMNKLADRRSLI